MRSRPPRLFAVGSSRQPDSRAGQVLPILALMGTLLIAATAIGVDLSVQTHYRRTLQNVSDAAALAGARDITWGQNDTGPSLLAQQAAVQDARATIRTSMNDLTGPGSGWAAPTPGWWSPTTPGAESCRTGSVPSPTPDGVYVSGAVGDYTFTINTPPVCSVTHNWDVRAVEVIINQVSTNGFASVIGIQRSTESGHATALHQPFGLPFGFAVYVRTVITGGATGEVFGGSVYAGDNISPQAGSGGAATSYICTEGGGVYLGDPQYPTNTTTSQYTVSPNGNKPDVIQQVSDCQPADVPGGYVSQTQQYNTCGQGISGVAFSGYWDGGSASSPSLTKACVFKPALDLPNLPGPSNPVSHPWTLVQANGANKSAMTITDGSAVSAGVYEVVHNPQCSVKACFDVTIDGGQITASGCSPTYAPFYSLCLSGVTFVLDKGATFGVVKGARVLDAPPFYPGYPGTPSGATQYDGVYPFWSQKVGDADDGSGIWVLDNNSSLSTEGTVYLPNGSVNGGSNAQVYIQGQSISDSWNVQSGNLQNPVVSYDGRKLAPQQEILRLVE